MALTKSFKELVQRRVAGDAAFAENLLREGIDTMLSGDVETGKALLRDYIKATVGFEKLREATDTPAKSLIRVRPARQSAGAQPLRHCRLPAKAGGDRTACHAAAAMSPGPFTTARPVARLGATGTRRKS
jgi:hypothetical protein